MTPLIHLDIGSGNSQNFLRAWQAWLVDPQRARMLHFVAICSDSFQNTTADAELKPLAKQLDTQLWGLLLGFHRLVFEGGHVLLTLCFGDVAKVLRQQQFKADSIFLNSASLAGFELPYIAKAIARLCKPGTRLATSGASNNTALQAALTQCGFEVAANQDALQATYNPSWVARQPVQPVQAVQPTTCIVIGAGLAGAAVASSLARRGWAVTVLNAASQSASGASGLPAGLLVPHTSPDDSPLSRLSRSGVRMTLGQARSHLRHGIDWGHTGVMQRRLQSHLHQLPPDWAQSQSRAAGEWCYPASVKILDAAGLPPDAQALWHVQAGWIKPAALVRAWLATPGITWRGGSQVTSLAAQGALWQVLDKTGGVVASADVVVISAGYASGLLLARLPATLAAVPARLQAIRGQVTFGLQKDAANLPPFAVNGHGGLIPAITTPEGPMWLMGASYERDVKAPTIKAQDHADNLARLQTLLPDAAEVLVDQFSPESAQAWVGIRCATPNRLPLVGRVDVSESSPGSSSGLWVCTGMGSRGLSFAALCGELLAARLHGEPLPIDSRLAKAMGMKV